MLGKIHSFQSLGTLDGPGVRFVAFMHGCNLHCGYCHNIDVCKGDYKEYSADEIIGRAVRFKEYFSDEGGITEEELLSIVEEVEQEGGIDEQESQIIRSAIEFTEEEAIDILTPRIDITAVSTEASKDEIAEVFAKTAYSRLPLYKDTLDNIIGIIYQKDFHNYVYHNTREISEIIRPVLFVPKNKKIIYFISLDISPLDSPLS